MSNKMYDNITGRSPIATDDLGYIGTGNKASDFLSSGTTDYNNLNNKPTINNVELKGNLTSSDLGLQSELNEGQTNAVNSGITAELTEQITANQNNISYLTLSGPSKTADVNNVTRNEFTLYNDSSPNLPTVDYYFVRTSIFSATGALQEAFNTTTAESYIRTKAFGVWSAWLQITNV